MAGPVSYVPPCCSEIPGMSGVSHRARRAARRAAPRQGARQRDRRALAVALAGPPAELAQDDGVGGVLLASAHPKLFCPGLDLVALVGLRPRRDGALHDSPSRERSGPSTGSRSPCVAAVNGRRGRGRLHPRAVADYRVLRRGAPIGLNEVKVGVPLPWSVTRLLRASVPAPALARIALLGRNFADEEAVAVGLAEQSRRARASRRVPRAPRGVRGEGPARARHDEGVAARGGARGGDEGARAGAPSGLSGRLVLPEHAGADPGHRGKPPGTELVESPGRSGTRRSVGPIEQEWA